MFQSSKSQCPVVRYELFTSSSLSTPWSDAAIQLLNGNDLATAALRVDRDNGFKKVLFLKASTSAGKFALIQLTQVVCGNEMIVANILQNYKNVLFPGDTFEFSAQDQSDCFSSAFYEENCQSECAQY
jgi:hypothetical protein